MRNALIITDMPVAFPKETGSVGETSNACCSTASHNEGELSGDCLE